jgi:uncharacterized protein (UPF0335 family)
LYVPDNNDIYDYYEKVRKIETLENRKKVIAEQINIIRQDIKNNNVNIIPDIHMGLQITEKVQTSSTGTSYAEGAIIKQIERLEKKVIELNNEMVETQCIISDIKAKYADIDYIINNTNLVNKENKTLIKQKYGTKYHPTNTEIGIQLNITESAIRNRLKNVLNDLYKYTNYNA